MIATAPAATQRMTLGPMVGEWIEEHCVHTKARWIGEPFRLLPWQWEVLNDLFEVEQDALGRWMRVIREAYLEIPKKQGKTELIAALALWVICEDDEPAAEVYCAANSEEQADLVFGAARTMCEVSPSLQRRTEVFKDVIFCADRPGSKLQRVAAAVGTNDGKNVYWAIFDELHEFTETKGRGLFERLTNGQAAREQPMTISITTAGHDEETLCGEKHQLAERIASGEVVNRRFLARFWSAPRDLDWRSREAVEAANPSFGHTVLWDFYANKLADVTLNPSVYQRFYLNWWVSSEVPWLPDGAWDACGIGPFELEPNAPTWVGVDAAMFQDSTAVVVLQWQAGRLRAKARIWERPLNPSTGKPVEGWVMPVAEVENHLRDLHGRFQLQAVGFDRRFMMGSAVQLEAEGLPMVEVPQSNARMCPAFAQLLEYVSQGQLAHDGDAAFARQIANGRRLEVSGGEGGWRVTKKREKKKIDACYALAIAVSVLDLQAEPTTPEPRSWSWEDLPHVPVG